MLNDKTASTSKGYRINSLSGGGFYNLRAIDSIMAA
jgi:hypothetical protein